MKDHKFSIKIGNKKHTRVRSSTIPIYNIISEKLIQQTNVRKALVRYGILFLSQITSTNRIHLLNIQI